MKLRKEVTKKLYNADAEIKTKEGAPKEMGKKVCSCNKKIKIKLTKQCKHGVKWKKENEKERNNERHRNELGDTFRWGDAAEEIPLPRPSLFRKLQNKTRKSQSQNERTKRPGSITAQKANAHTLPNASLDGAQRPTECNARSSKVEDIT